MAVNSLKYTPNTQTLERFPCSGCKQLVERVQRCAECLKATYCSVACQTIHWKKIHRVACSLNNFYKIKHVIKEIQAKWPPNEKVKKLSVDSSEAQFKGINLDILGNNLSIHVIRTASILNYLQQFATLDLNMAPAEKQVNPKPIRLHLTQKCIQPLCDRYDFETANASIRQQYNSLIKEIIDVAKPCGELKTISERKAFLTLVITAYRTFFNLQNECFQRELASLDITAETRGEINQQLAKFNELVEKVCAGVNKSL